MDSVQILSQCILDDIMSGKLITFVKPRTMKKTDKRFIVRKYVMAHSALDAIKNEKKIEVADVWIDDEWLKIERPNQLEGFGENK